MRFPQSPVTNTFSITICVYTQSATHQTKVYCRWSVNRDQPIVTLVTAQPQVVTKRPGNVTSETLTSTLKSLLETNLFLNISSTSYFSTECHYYFNKLRNEKHSTTWLLMHEDVHEHSIFNKTFFCLWQT